MESCELHFAIGKLIEWGVRFGPGCFYVLTQPFWIMNRSTWSATTDPTPPPDNADVCSDVDHFRCHFAFVPQPVQGFIHIVCKIITLNPLISPTFL
jgi:hypothetical protein